jgi:2-oxoglutarate ferredoxin oxidoreductase subunit gamma
MTRSEVKFAGFGGQGIILSGFIIGKAVSIFENRHSVLTQSYGPEARGGACSAEVVVSDTEIDYPYIDTPNILILMSQEAYNIYRKKLRDKGDVLYDIDLVTLEDDDKDANFYGIPATLFAEELGKKIVANIVMLGFLTAVTGIVNKEAMKKAVESSVPKPFLELNIKAFEKGYEHGIEAKKNHDK